jgi:FkbM family methyltransferase
MVARGLSPRRLTPSEKVNVSEPKRPFQLFRRDFLVGAVGGVAAGLGLTRAATAVMPPGLSGRLLHDGASLSYAQSGEDLVLASLFRRLGVAAPSYLDIGAFEPVECNNTYLFYRLGGRGVLVEPNVDLAPKLRRVRPGDVTLNVGVGVTDDPAADFYVMEDEQRHTFDKGVAEMLQQQGMKLREVVKMPLVNVNQMIADHFGGAAPDLLSIDIEGMDYAVLKTLDVARFRPKVVCTETLVPGTPRHNPDTLALMTAHGYEVRGMTYANTIFLDRKLI